MRKLSYVAAAMLAMPLYPLFSIPANGEGDAVGEYVSQHGGEVCEVIGEQPGLPGVKHAVDRILATSELPEDQTGRLLGASVTGLCPEYGDLVREFVWYVQHHQRSLDSGNNIGVLGF